MYLVGHGTCQEHSLFSGFRIHSSRFLVTHAYSTSVNAVLDSEGVNDDDAYKAMGVSSSGFHSWICQ